MAMKESLMASYSVATTKDHLSALIDKALAGEEVVITRRGKATVELRPRKSPSVDIGAATDRLEARLAERPRLAIPSSHFRAWLYADENY
jgi:antitoxin (DNA-binding transcriptional repressor) of toxin-antitoxin stability system